MDALNHEMTELRSMAEGANLSREEELNIYRMLGSEFSTMAGHFYTCPNGHVYVIADCGNPVEGARCADCGASIGGNPGYGLLARGNEPIVNIESVVGRRP
jgi:hypothetical protein